MNTGGPGTAACERVRGAPLAGGIWELRKAAILYAFCSFHQQSVPIAGSAPAREPAPG